MLRKQHYEETKTKGKEYENQISNLKNQLQDLELQMSSRIQSVKIQANQELLKGK